ncbi:MAG TPA: D-sedoheptulose 7-phosphate isomerase [Patescibacteria group bacterium]|nr:D-sedoheptulose 7-phosphate isomerase [Patescibacteria group bacterium]
MKASLLASAEVKRKSARLLVPKIEKVVNVVVLAYKKGKKVFFCGNGGSAADSQHLAAELVGRFKRERRGLPAISLTTDTSILTAVTNDYWYDFLFARQLEALGQKGDVLFGLSTSGNSINIVRAVEFAKSMGITTVGFLGGDGGKLKDLVDIPLVVPASSSDRVQETHITIGHIVCDLVEEDLFG